MSSGRATHPGWWIEESSAASFGSLFLTIQKRTLLETWSVCVADGELGRSPHRDTGVLALFVEEVEFEAEVGFAVLAEEVRFAGVLCDAAEDFHAGFFGGRAAAHQFNGGE